MLERDGFGAAGLELIDGMGLVLELTSGSLYGSSLGGGLPSVGGRASSIVP